MNMVTHILVALWHVGYAFVSLCCCMWKRGAQDAKDKGRDIKGRETYDRDKTTTISRPRPTIFIIEFSHDPPPPPNKTSRKRTKIQMCVPNG